MEKRTKQYTGGVVDQTIPDKAKAIIKLVSNDQGLQDDFGVLLGKYRGEAEFRDTAPAKYQLIDELKSIIESSKKLSAKLNLLPSSIDVIFAEKCQLAGHDLVAAHSYIEALEKQLNFYQVIFESVTADIKGMPAPKGRKPKFREKILLSDVARLFEVANPDNGLIKSALLASQALMESGVADIPHDKEGKKQREAIKKVRDSTYITNLFW